MKTATFVRKCTGWAGDARLYRLSEPLEGHEYVIVSAVSAPPFVDLPPSMLIETYIFPAEGPTANDALDWGDLPGSIKGTLSHAEALAEAGYEIVGAGA